MFARGEMKRVAFTAQSVNAAEVTPLSAGRTLTIR